MAFRNEVKDEKTPLVTKPKDDGFCSLFCLFQSSEPKPVPKPLPAPIRTADFILCNLAEITLAPGMFPAVMVFDFDGVLKVEPCYVTPETISYHDRNTALIHPQKINKVLEASKNKKLLIICVTSRPYLENNHSVVVGVLQKIHPDAFVQIYYTGHQNKSLVLNYIQAQLKLSSKNLYCFIDDSREKIMDCRREGYSQSILFQADQIDTTLSYVNAFLKSVPDNFQPRIPEPSGPLPELMDAKRENPVAQVPTFSNAKQ